MTKQETGGKVNWKCETFILDLPFHYKRWGLIFLGCIHEEEAQNRTEARCIIKILAFGRYYIVNVWMNSSTLILMKAISLAILK